MQQFMLRRTKGNGRAANLAIRAYRRPVQQLWRRPSKALVPSLAQPPIRLMAGGTGAASTYCEYWW
jgi:hypothetical protein